MYGITEHETAETDRSNGCNAFKISSRYNSILGNE
jgi:hypothetical protein